jgi:hypothetical protein
MLGMPCFLFLFLKLTILLWLLLPWLSPPGYLSPALWNRDVALRLALTFPITMLWGLYCESEGLYSSHAYCVYASIVELARRWIGVHA